MTRWIRSFLQLLILALGGFLLWRNRALPWPNLALLAAFLCGLFLMASMLGSRFAKPDYPWAQCTEKVSVVIALVGLGLPLIMWSPWPLVLLPAWWGLLIAYLTHPAGSDFQAARQYFRDLGAQASAPSMFAKRGAFIVAFWPVFIPKGIYFWGLVLLGSVWLLRNFWLPK